MAIQNEIDINLEMVNIALAGGRGESQLISAISELVIVYGVEESTPTPYEISTEILELASGCMAGVFTPEERDLRLKAILVKALTAKDKPLGEDVGDCTQATS